MKTLKLRLAALATALMLAASAFAACGDDDEEDSDSAATTETTTEAAADTESVTLTADDAGGDYTFDLSATPTAETTEVVFDNQGEEPHFLAFARINEGYTLDEVVELEGKEGSADVVIEKGAGPGQAKTFAIEGPLEPGDYAMLCPIPGPGGKAHYQLGQLEEFSIE